MTKRRKPTDAVADERGPGQQRPASAAASSFEAAQALMQAALEEIRRSDPGTSPSLWDEPGPNAEAGTGAPLPRRRRRAPQEAERPPEPSPAASSEPERRSRPGRIRSRRPARREALEPDELEGLTETLFEDSGRGRHRRRVHPEAPRALILDPRSDTPSPLADLLPEVRPRPDSVAAFAVADTETEAPAGAEPAVEGTAPAFAGSADDPVLVLARAGPEPIPHPYAPPSRRRHRTRQLIAALGAAAVVLAVLVVVLTTGGSNEPAIRTALRARLTFDPVTTPDGVTVTRVWELRGKDGSRFVGKLDFANPTSQPRQASFIEEIPKSLASSVGDITFDPQPTVLRADPIVQFTVSVPAGGSASARYEIGVAPEGVSRARLESWAEDLPERTTPSTTTTTSATVPTSAGPSTATTTPSRGQTTTRTTTRTAATPTAPTAAPGPPPTNPPPTNPPPTNPPPTNPPPTNPPPTNPPPATGKIVIRVISRAGTGITFEYSGAGFVTLTTSGSPNGVAETAPTSFEVGTYSFTQSTPDGWVLDGISCNDSGSEHPSSGSGSTATFRVDPGETVMCTFTNRKA